MRLALGLLLAAAAAIPITAQTRPRGRDLGIPFPGQTGPLNAITDVAGHRGRTRDAHRGRGQTRARQGSDSDRRHRDSPASARQLGSGFRGDVQPERQRRHDRHQLDQGIRLSRGADPDHRDAQRRHGARCRDSMAIEERPSVRLHLSNRRRDVRFPERCERRAREGGARIRGARSGRSLALWRRAPSAAAPEWAATDSRAASAPPRAC